MPGCSVQHDVIVWQSTFSGFNLLCIQSNRLNNKVSVVNKVSMYTDSFFPRLFSPCALGAFMELLCLDLSVPRSGCVRLPGFQTTGHSFLLAN